MVGSLSYNLNLHSILDLVRPVTPIVVTSNFVEAHSIGTPHSELLLYLLLGKSSTFALPKV